MDYSEIREVKTFRQLISAAPEVVFPLLCPVREKEWLEGWDYMMVYSKSGLIENGCVFYSPHHGSQQTIWSVTEHDKAKYRIEFVRFTPGEETVKIRIRLHETEKGKTTIDISYEYTALNDAKIKWFREGLDESFQKSMIWWENALNYYISTGEMLKK